MHYLQGMCESKAAAELESSRRLKRTEKKKIAHRFGHNAMKCTTGANKRNAATTSHQQQASKNNNNKQQVATKTMADDAYKFVILDATATFINLKFNLKWSRHSPNPAPPCPSTEATERACTRMCENLLQCVCVCVTGWCEG